MEFLETMKKNNIKLNFDKIQYKQKEVEFFGEIYTMHGCKPSNTKSKVITEMPKLACLKDLQTFLELQKFLNHYMIS